MSDYYMRDAAPIDAATWAKIDDMVVTVAKKTLVGRRLLHLVGPLGWGVELVPVFGFTESDGAAVVTDTTEYLRLIENSQEFILKAKQLAMASQTPFGLDLGAVATAASKLTRAEDEVVIGGMLKAAGTTSALGDWDTLGGPFQAVATAIARLQAAEVDGPFALVLSPAMFARLASLMREGRRELDLVSKLVEEGIFQSRNMPDDAVLVVSPQPWNADLVVGQDIVTSYVGNEGLDQRFRVFETLALRVKRAEAFCVLK
ncbi:MAG: family 1 encapsulin nanocompartment shell protein [Anaerolineales bacterium]